MTIEQKNMNATPVAASQIGNGIAAVNDRINREETANHGASSFALAGTEDTMTSAELWDGSLIALTGAPSGPFTLTVPAEERGPVKFVNTTGKAVTVTIAAQPGDAPVIPAGGEGTLRIDGTNVSVEAVITLGINRVIAISQAAYDALGTPDATTLYVINS
ncbi:hypothetical protein [Mesorhizobium sp. WSM3626]|uniref:phage upper tail fiber protein n=1 Tax=Mesorhizobium sp. WSM3626 TaxID=1040987 RepID=UPI0004B87D8F|nr:hypothetical protein [Mesorhizobium sp. WSM3626]